MGRLITVFIYIYYIDRRWRFNIYVVRTFRGTDCDTGHYLVVVNVGERLAVSKQAAQILVWKDLFS